MKIYWKEKTDKERGFGQLHREAKEWEADF